MKEKKIIVLIALMTFAVFGLAIIQIFWSIRTVKTEEIKFDATVNTLLDNVILKIEKERTANILIEKVGKDTDRIVWVEEELNGIDSNRVIFLSKNSNTKNIQQQHHVEIQVETQTENDEKTEVKIVKRFFNKDAKGAISEEHESKIDTIIYEKENLVSEVLEEMISFQKVNYFTSQLSESMLDSLIDFEFLSNGIHTDFYFGVYDTKINKFIIIKTNSPENELLATKYAKKLSPLDMFSKSILLKLYIPNTFEIIIKSIWMMFALTLLFLTMIVFVYVKTVQMFLRQKKVTEVKNDLINNITHEFKTPISSIMLASEALAEPKLASQENSIKKYSNIILEENKKLNKLVENLLNTAAFEKSEIELNFEEVNILEFIENISSKFKKDKDNISIGIIDNLKDKKSLKVDKFHFTNVVLNLFENAEKYSTNETRIEIRLQIKNGSCVIQISDNGIGISKSDQQKIFDTFYRVQSGNIHNIKGYGIGLSYVKKIVESHNGKIEVESKLGEGTTFIISLPNG